MTGRRRLERRAPSPAAPRSPRGSRSRPAGEEPRGQSRSRAPAPGTLDLSVTIGPLRLRNPVLTASGTFGYGDEYAHVMDVAALGGVITKTVTLAPRAGNPPGRIAETPSGMLNSIGLENVGLARFVSEKLPRLRALKATVVASIGGETPRELEELLETLGAEPGIAGFEINFSCPNVAAGGARYWAVPRRLERTLARLRTLTRRALIAKLSPDVTSIGDLARACEQGGADAVTAANTFVGMAVDLFAMRSRLGRATGGLSGPAIKPLALARCHECARAVRIPVLGSGGIMTARDALEYVAVGATAVQVGTANFIRPDAALRIVEGMRAFLAERGVRSIARWRGALLEAPDAQDGARAQRRSTQVVARPRPRRRSVQVAAPPRPGRRSAAGVPSSRARRRGAQVAASSRPRRRSAR
ncbi:MAG: dihydroorotate dehydrogenase [Candidatus Eisenbacteria bacterium]|nr:dihydroorotate dehydrogenase [Candidatus Eisenbacteria bacterium]